ncbi:protein-disulfide reductase DsbD family protein [Vulgatibacter incomptus]|uniref:Cytochrome c-type biogenesis protein DsbD, protein-disulfide reductase n=1 Tax=Vulgatibacter incomptus TaxID=1391653 RepID=A0A0K1PFL2_9BACT|nr:cytochrome c biogenesis protein CcdA [Vulgatibacter incomptus]AKU91904.1 Cytochrome c-type biogenesis protein DsbD, protein-disulfide reductase [Vulgatibacter incomptus]
MRSAVLLLVGGLASAGAVLFLPDLMGQGLSSHQLDASALSSGILGALAVAWLGGVLTSLTPCVYPLIPITLGVFGARQAGSRLKSFGLVTTYVLGMAAMFSGLGFAAASSGKAFGTILANPWVLVGLATFFAVMASSMFGAFELAVPQGLAQRLNRVGGTGFGGAFAMGLVAGVVAAPCTGPVLASLLTVVASSGQPVFGLLLLFTYALGVGLPFFLLGGFSVSLPRSGAWMDGVKSVFGVALLAMAFLYLRDALPALREIFRGLSPHALAGPAIVLVGVLLGAIHLSFHGGARERILKGAGVALVVAGLVLRLGASSGAEGVEWSGDYHGALAQARAEGKPVIIDFYADWCAACKELDKFTYTDARVMDEAARFVTVKVDGTHEDKQIQALYDQYGIQGLPTVVFLDSTGETLPSPRVTGFVEAGNFLELMKGVR